MTQEQISKIQLRPSADEIVPNLPPHCAGSFQELGYYRHGVKRAECLLPYWDKIDFIDLPGIDLDFHNRLEDYKRILEADDALTRLKLRLASKAFNPKLIITDKIAPSVADIKCIFAVIKEIPGNLDFHGSPCYEEALRAFGRMEIGSFLSYLSDIIGLDSFQTFKKECADFIRCVKRDELPHRFAALKESYSSFVDDIRACEDDEMSIGFAGTDDSKVDFEEILGELKNTEDDFNWIIKTLKSMPDNQDRESEWKDRRGCFFNVSINPKHNPFSYETKSLRLYSFVDGRSAPDEIEELINSLADQWNDMFTLLDRKFSFLSAEVEAAQSAFETFMDFIGDADEYTPGDTACEVVRKTNVQNIEKAMVAIARALEKSHSKETRQTNDAKNSSIPANEGNAVDTYRKIMVAEHEHSMRCMECPKKSATYEKASDVVIDSLLTICQRFKSGYQDKLKQQHDELALQLAKMPKSDELYIPHIKLHAIRYIIELNRWSSYLRGESSERPQEIKYNDSYYLNIGEWVKCTILPYILTPLKDVIKILPKLNAPTRTYPIIELQEMFVHLEAMIGMLNYCEEEETSPEGTYLGFTVIAVNRLHQLVCPKETRPGHVILECQSISRAYAEFFKRMCNAAWALGFKVENRDRNEINLEDELSKVIPSAENSVVKNNTTTQQSSILAEALENPPIKVKAMETSREGGKWVKGSESANAREIAKEVAAELRKEPFDARIVDVAPSAGKSLRAAMKDPGGRPSKSSNDHAANSFTQKRIAEMFGPPCTDEIVSNWESRARGGKRGSTPPSAKYKDRLVSYCAELRKFPIGENLEILAAIIEQYKATEGVKAATAKPKTIHCKSDETLARASGQIEEAKRERSHLKNGE